MLSMLRKDSRVYPGGDTKNIEDHYLVTVSDELTAHAIALLRENALNQLPKLLGYIPFHGCQTKQSDNKSFNLEKEVNFFLKEDRQNSRVLVLLGDMGIGKTTFTQNLVRQLWEEYQPGDAIPMWISLPDVKNFKKLIEEDLKKSGLNNEHIETIKKDNALIIFLDDYDGLYQWNSIFIHTDLNEWQAKIIVTCRAQATFAVPDYEKYFTPFIGEKRQAHLVRSIKMISAPQDEIKNYIARNHKSASFDLELLHEILPLVFLPLFLNYLLLHWQDIEKPMSIKDILIQYWFQYQEEKLKKNGIISQKENPKPYFLKFCKELATMMQASSLTSVKHPSKKTSRLFPKKESNHALENVFSQDKINQWTRSACLWFEVSPQQYHFPDESWITYFTEKNLDIIDRKNDFSRSSVIAVGPHATSRDLLNQQYITQQPAMLSFLVDRANNNPKFVDWLWEYVLRSKNNPDAAIGAANAITVLNKQGFF